jgi:hypothetical protein
MNNTERRVVNLWKRAAGAMSATKQARVLSRESLANAVVAFGLFIGGFGLTQLSTETLGLGSAVASGIEPSHIGKMEMNPARPNLAFVQFGIGSPTLDRK